MFRNSVSRSSLGARGSSRHSARATGTQAPTAANRPEVRPVIDPEYLAILFSTLLSYLSPIQRPLKIICLLNSIEKLFLRRHNSCLNNRLEIREYHSLQNQKDGQREDHSQQQQQHHLIRHFISEINGV